MNKRTAREITVKSEFLNNENINVKVGTVENRDCPQTIYINISFWIKPIKKDATKESIELYLNNLLNNKLVKFLQKNIYFPFEKQNIYICNIPENFNYNDKSNFISLETYLHTLNIKSEKKYSLNAKKDKELFEECVKICNFVGDEIMKMESDYKIIKKLK